MQDKQKSSVAYIVVTTEEQGQRIDNYLITRLKGLPQSRLYRLLRKGEIRINKKRIMPEYRLLAGDQIRLPPLWLLSKAPVLVPGASLVNLLQNRILYEDDDLLIINKPSGLAVHAGSTIKMGVIEALKSIYTHLPQLELAHRLDTETSGCLILAKKKRMLRELHVLLREGQIKKVYWALTKGNWGSGEKQVNEPLYKDYRDGGKHVVRVDHTQGKPAFTCFSSLAESRDASWVEAIPMTGRTHQIRVHAAHSGHPIAGDDRYGDIAFNKLARDKGVSRLFLHARRLQLIMPFSNQPLTVTAPLDQDLEDGLLAFQCKQ